MAGRLVDDEASTGKARLNFEELTTVLTEVEVVVNSRPLTYVESDSEEPGALTPADLIIGRRLITPPQSSNDLSVDSALLSPTLEDQLWAIQRAEYATSTHELLAVTYAGPLALPINSQGTQ
ncbi:uncharacterized protein [Dermacentor albipictus]|uniref:uncharacterized protein n=1 Tax=Dermacentor albipictus TaxID=60249 RepID=UPI0038FCB233